MKATIYQIKCLTNLHVGNGDINYNIVDNEVEKDPVTGNPAIYASSLKGALRKYFEEKMAPRVEKIFGSSQKTARKNQGRTEKGQYKFFDAHILARPLRTSSGEQPYILVTTIEQIQRYYQDLINFGLKVPDNLEDQLEEIKTFFQNKEIVFGVTENMANCEIEGELTKPLSLDEACSNWLRTFLGHSFAITKDTTLQYFDLPVFARNQLDEGESQNLWYEEMVPHESCFYFTVLRPDDEPELSFDGLVQIGGNATIGCGFCKITKLQ